MITELQKSRVRFHLGFPNDLVFSVPVRPELVLGNLSTETQMALVGLGSGTPYLCLGAALCQEGSLLANLEEAYRLLGPGTISDSLFVVSAGSVTLRKDELKARKALYQSLREDLSRLLGVELYGQTGGPHSAY